MIPSPVTVRIGPLVHTPIVTDTGLISNYAYCGERIDEDEARAGRWALTCESCKWHHDVFARMGDIIRRMDA